MSAEIENILRQVETTVLSHAHFNGHIISVNQLTAIRRALHQAGASSESFPRSRSPDTPEPLDPAEIRANLELEQLSLESTLTELREASRLSDKSSRPALNLRIGQVQSQLASISRRLQQ